MKIIVSSLQLLKNLQVVNGIINTNTTVPILDNFLFSFENNTLEVTATDLENTMTFSMQIDTTEKGSYCVPSKLLIDVLKTLPEQPITFIFSNNNMVEISSEYGRYELAYAPSEQFPSSPNIENPSRAVVPSKILSKAINKTIFATGNDDLRPTMTGVYFQLTTNGLIFTSTDAHKLVKYSRNDITSDQDAFFIMPKKPLNVLKSVLSTIDEDVEIQFNETNASFIFGIFVLSSRLVDGKYPNYENVIPKENPNKLVISKSLFLNSINCVSIFSNKTTHQIKMNLSKEELDLSAEDKDYSNKGDEKVKCSYEGVEMQIGFNGRYLIEMLRNIDSSDVQLEMSMPNRAGILAPIDGLDEGEELLMLIMPSIIND